MWLVHSNPFPHQIGVDDRFAVPVRIAGQRIGQRKVLLAEPQCLRIRDLNGTFLPTEQSRLQNDRVRASCESHLSADAVMAIPR
jgi:hypothetical protein